jgi:monovalent cation:proton antiporter-2 (CPA2) family protein
MKGGKSVGPHLSFFFTLLIILFTTKVAGDLSVRLGQPAVLGKLIVGIVIGPAFLGWIESSTMIEELSQIGVLLLMFIAGLETDIKQLNENLKASIAVAIGGVVLPFAGGYSVGLAMGMSQGHSIFLGLLLCATSVSISVETLRDIGKLNSREGTTILGAAVVDDVLVVVLLAFLMSFLGGGDVNLSLIILKKVAFFIAIILIGWKAVPWIMGWLARHRVQEAVISAALIICFFFAYLAEYLGVAGIIGAFAAGIAVSQTGYKHEVEERIEPIAYAIFVPIFFVGIGLSVSFEGMIDHIWFILTVTLIAIFTKLAGSGLGARISGFNLRSSLGIGSGMVSRGEVALIIAAIGLEAGLLLEQYFTSLIIVVILTTLVTPPLLKKIFAGERKESSFTDENP